MKMITREQVAGVLREAIPQLAFDLPKDIEQGLADAAAREESPRAAEVLRLLREKPQYNIAAVAEEAGFGNVRTLQRRIQEVIGMTPVEYRAMLTRDKN